MDIYTIYKAKNTVNGKVYIGFDSNWPNRIRTHKTDFNRKNTYFYYAIRKYGWSNFEWDVIYQSKDKDHTLNEMEKYFINEYDSYNEGYNLTFGGEGTIGFKFSESSKKHMSETRMGENNPFYGKRHTEKAKKRNFDYSGENNPRFGATLTEITKEKQRNKLCKRLYEVSCPDGTIVSTNNLKKFCRDYNLDDSNLYNTIKRKQSNHKGYVATIIEQI
jgi:group I intron endonuclease